MNRILIAGGGWAGCSAALTAAKQGAEVILLEKTDLLLGAGNVGGIMRNNGRFTAAEENIALGAGELFEITDRYAVHRNVDFPGHEHASFYDAEEVEPAVRQLLSERGVDVKLISRAVDVKLQDSGNRRLEAVKVIGPDRKVSWMEADTFVEATGSSGPMGNCMRYGKGCALCIQRCPAFGPRVSLTARAGASDLMARRNRMAEPAPLEGNLYGAFSGSCKLEKSSLSRDLQKKLKKKGFAVVPLPEELVRRGKLQEKVCQQYALDAFAENVILLDVGQAKLMTPFMPLAELRQVPGFARARYVDPYAGGQGNSIRYMSVGECDPFMRAAGFENLFLAGEKSGFFVGHTEAITTGALAGYNAARSLSQTELLTLPRTLATGELLAYAREILTEEYGLARRLTFAGGEFFQRMKELGLYRMNPAEIRSAVEEAGLSAVYDIPPAV